MSRTRFSVAVNKLSICSGVCLEFDGDLQKYNMMQIRPGLNSSTKFTKTAKIRNYRNFRKIRCHLRQDVKRTRDIHVIFVVFAN